MKLHYVRYCFLIGESYWTATFYQVKGEWVVDTEDPKGELLRWDAHSRVPRVPSQKRARKLIRKYMEILKENE